MLAGEQKLGFTMNCVVSLTSKLNMANPLLSDTMRSGTVLFSFYTSGSSSLNSRTSSLVFSTSLFSHRNVCEWSTQASKQAIERAGKQNLLGLLLSGVEETTVAVAANLTVTLTASTTDIDRGQQQTSKKVPPL